MNYLLFIILFIYINSHIQLQFRKGRLLHSSFPIRGPDCSVGERPDFTRCFWRNNVFYYTEFQWALELEGNTEFQISSDMIFKAIEHSVTNEIPILLEFNRCGMRPLSSVFSPYPLPSDQWSCKDNDRNEASETVWKLTLYSCSFKYFLGMRVTTSSIITSTRMR